VQWLLYLILILTLYNLYSVQSAYLFPTDLITDSICAPKFLNDWSLQQIRRNVNKVTKSVLFIGQEVNFVLRMMKQVLKRSKT
jgi:hypothetical protein